MLALHAGKRMLAGDWTECPVCHCSANMRPFMRLLEAEQQCPMCGVKVKPTDLRRGDAPHLR